MYDKGKKIIHPLDKYAFPRKTTGGEAFGPRNIQQMLTMSQAQLLYLQEMLNYQ